VLLMLMLAVPSERAAAQGSAANAALAQSLFDSGVKLLEAQNYAEACPTLEESERLDPGKMGTLYTLAECYKASGRLASAWAKFRDAASAAERAGMKDRAEYARARAHELRVPTLMISVPPAVSELAGFEVRDNGTKIARPAWGKPLSVDPGEHKIIATSEGKKPWEKVITIAEGAAETVIVETPVGDLQPPPPPQQPPACPQQLPLQRRPPHPSSPSPLRSPAGTLGPARIGGVIALYGVEVAGIIIGGVYGLRANDRLNDALKECENRDPTKCKNPEIATVIKKEATYKAHISTAAFIISGAGFAGALLLTFLPAKGSAKPSNTQTAFFATADRDGFGVWALGRF